MGAAVLTWMHVYNMPTAVLLNGGESSIECKYRATGAGCPQIRCKILEFGEGRIGKVQVPSARQMGDAVACACLLLKSLKIVW